MKQWCIAGTARRNGMVYALVAAVLFGASTPVAKMLLGSFSPLLLAAVFYLGSAGGLFGWRLISKRLNRKPSAEAELRRTDFGWLTAAIFSGGLVGPLLLFFGLKLLPASTTSLLLNLEGVFTAVLAWLVFKEGVDRRLLIGMAAITGGGMLLALNGTTGNGAPQASLLVVGACLAWAVDNNLTRKVSAGDPIQIAMLKGTAAGTFSLLLAVVSGCQAPSLTKLAAAALVGLFGYGVSLSCFVLALREIGAARTAAYFACAPFFGAFLAVYLLREPVPLNFLAAATLMGIGVYLHLTEEHQHEHAHPVLEHEHQHVHDEHHQHEHAGGQALSVPHSHWHRHEPTVHSHPHFPDLHHLHDH